MTPSFGVGAWFGSHWHGPEQVENKSTENVRRCYAYLRRVPYQTEEDRERLLALEVEAVLEAE